MDTAQTSRRPARWVLAITILMGGAALIAWFLRGQPDQTVTIPLAIHGQKVETISDGLLLYVKGDGGAVSLTVVPKNAGDSPPFCNKNLVGWEEDGPNSFVAFAMLTPHLNVHYPNPRHIPICGFPLELIARVKDPRFHKFNFAGGSLVITIRHVDATKDKRNYIATE